MAHDAHNIRRTELARHIAMLHQADADDLAGLRGDMLARCYPPTHGDRPRVNPRGLAWLEDDPEDNRALVALFTRLWPTRGSQDS